MVDCYLLQITVCIDCKSYTLRDTQMVNSSRNIFALNYLLHHGASKGKRFNPNINEGECHVHSNSYK